MEQTGWRKPTPGLGVAEQHAQAGEWKDVPKSRALVSIKRVGVHIGLKASDLMLLDTLSAFAQPQDWEEGRRPIVWPSNAYLIRRTGFSLSALKRHTRRLAEAGVIAFRDSPNGKRWGRRSTSGHIIEAYGFDLTPLQARVEEFEHLHETLQAEHALCQFLRRQLTVTRRMIRAHIETALQQAYRGPWGVLQDIFENLLKELPRRTVDSPQLSSLLERFTQLQENVSQALMHHQTEIELELDRADKAQTAKPHPKVAKNDPHILDTNHFNFVDCSEPDPVQAITSTKNKIITELYANPTQGPTSTRYPELTVIQRVCPEFLTWAQALGNDLQNWNDYARVASDLRPMIGITEKVWTKAQEMLGIRAATAALALVFERSCAGQIASADKYLQAMTIRAATGRLHLERSFYGRLRALSI